MKKIIILSTLLTILSIITGYIVLTMNPNDFRKHAENFSSKIKNIQDNKEHITNFNIVSQTGLNYSPINVLNNISNINDLVPNSTISIDILKNSESVFQAINSDNSSYNIACLDIASMLFYYDKLLSNNNEIKMKVLLGLSVPQYELFTSNNKRYKNIASLGKNDKIAISSIGATEHIILSMAAKKELKDAHKLDKNVIAMDNNDAKNALLKKEITAHFADASAIKNDGKDNGKPILKSKDIIANASIICMADSTFYNKHNAEFDNFTLTVNDIVTLINQNEESILKKIAELNNISIEETLPKQLKYTTEIFGIEELYKFMKDNNYLKNEIDINKLFLKEITQK